FVALDREPGVSSLRGGRAPGAPCRRPLWVGGGDRPDGERRRTGPGIRLADSGAAGGRRTRAGGGHHRGPPPAPGVEEPEGLRSARASDGGFGAARGVGRLLRPGAVGGLVGGFPVLALFAFATFFAFGQTAIGQ